MQRRKQEKKRERLERKSQPEIKWEMLRWITNYIDEHKDRWDEEDEERRNSKKENIRDW